jgi:K+/H+ antiporter YhaU regulatory subunit KhtT
MKIESYQVGETSFARGKSLADLRLRTMCGSSVIALGRAGKVVDNPRPSEPLQAGDVLYLVGSLEQIRDSLVYLDTGTGPEALPVGQFTKIFRRPSEVLNQVKAPDHPRS